MGNEAFDRYAPFIKDFIYRSRWDSLRGVQMAAADAIFNTDENVLLTSSTASGKTEAAFFPILTLLSEDPPASVGALYIGPLKALINDQFGRLTDLCREAGIPVWHWHGDVSQTHKEKLIRHPSGILQITPESLEGMLLHRHGDVARLFGDLRFIVIDEVHSLIKGDRGGQTLCLIERLSRLAGCNPRRIGLSATIGNPGRTGEFLAAGTGRGTAIPEVSEPRVRWRLSMEHFFIQGEQAVPAEGSDPLPPLDSATDRAPRNADPGYAYVFEHTRGRKCLVFSNSREECEEVCSTLRHYCEANREPDRFLIHHGNISPALRETAERAMRDETRDLTVCTTATLELGVDVGRLERAFQIDAPWTVSAFLQRMGRTGRRGQPPEMWFVMREDEAEARAMLPAAVPWTLIQGIALVQTYREDRWVEPPRLDRLPYSLLFHQTLCTLAGGGEMSPGVLAGRVLGLSYFHRVTRDDYRVLLRHLISTDMVERTGRGGLIVGLAGERLISSYRFLATFQENEEFTVRSESMELGTIVRPPPVGEKVAIAGRVWTVDTVDLKRHLLTVTEVKGRVPAFFGLEPGDMDTRILLRMRGVLSEDRSYPYLMANAVGRLAEARETARAAGITERPLVNLGGDMWCLFPWLGTYPFLALERFIKRMCAEELGLSGLDSDRPFFMQFSMKASEQDFYRVLVRRAEGAIDPMDLVYDGEVPVFEKYDEHLPDELVRKGFAHGVLDVEGMRERVLGWKGLIEGRSSSIRRRAGSSNRKLDYTTSPSPPVYRIAVYGKGGIGKSTVSANLSYLLSMDGNSVLHVGCDPKHDSTRLLMHGRSIRTFFSDTSADPVRSGANGVSCVECGGAEPGRGCAGKGLELLFRRIADVDADYRVADVLGDVVCGGFSVPVRTGNADAVLIVTSGEFMSLYAANNILRGLGNIHPGRCVAGLVFNRRGDRGEEAAVRRFADAVGLPIVCDIPRSALFADAEAAGEVLSGLHPGSDEAGALRGLARLMESYPHLEAPRPLSEEGMADIAAGRLVTHLDGPRRSRGCTFDGFDAERNLTYTGEFVMPACTSHGAVDGAMKVSDAAVILHGPRNCAYLMEYVFRRRTLYGTSERSGPVPEPGLYSTGLDAASAFRDTGAEVEAAVRRAMADGYRTGFLISTCSTEVMGVDIPAVAGAVGARTGMDLIPVSPDETFLSGKFGGTQGLMEALVSRMRPREPEKGTVNLIGRWLYGIGRDESIAALDDILGRMGLRVRFCFLDFCTMARIEDFCSAEYDIQLGKGRLAERLSSMISERTGRRRAVRLETPSGLCESLEWVRGLAAYDPSLAPLLPSAEESLRRDFRKGLEPFRSALEGRRVVLFAYIRRYPRVQMEVLEELGAEIVAVLREKPFVIDHNEPDFGSIRVMEEATVCDLRRLKEDEGFDLVVTNDPDRVSRAGFRWAPMGSRYMGLKGAVEWARTLADCIRLDPAGWEGSL